jgi:hypothetical protein
VPVAEQNVATHGHWVSTAGQLVSTTWQFVTVAGHCVDAHGQAVFITGQTVIAIGHFVSVAGHLVRAAGHCVSTVGQKLIDVGCIVAHPWADASLDQPETRTHTITRNNQPILFLALTIQSSLHKDKVASGVPLVTARG